MKKLWDRYCSAAKDFSWGGGLLPNYNGSTASHKGRKGSSSTPHSSGLMFVTHSKEKIAFNKWQVHEPNMYINFLMQCSMWRGLWCHVSLGLSYPTPLCGIKPCNRDPIERRSVHSWFDIVIREEIKVIFIVLMLIQRKVGGFFCCFF